MILFISHGIVRQVKCFVLFSPSNANFRALDISLINSYIPRKKWRNPAEVADAAVTDTPIPGSCERTDHGGWIYFLRYASKGVARHFSFSPKIFLVNLPNNCPGHGSTIATEASATGETLEIDPLHAQLLREYGTMVGRCGVRGWGAVL